MNITSLFKKSNSIENTNTQLYDSPIWSILKTLIYIGLLAVVTSGIITVWSTQSFLNNLKAYLLAASTGVLIAGASFTAGGLGGFLFGIPSVLNKKGGDSTEKWEISQNDNLVEISDWLTKIIVGVGLTQLYHIPRFLKKISYSFEASFGSGIQGGNLALATMIYFTVLGFFSSYIWTRIYFIRMLKTLSDGLYNQLKEESKKKDETIQQQDQAIQQQDQAIQQKDVEMKEVVEKKEELTKAFAQTFEDELEKIKTEKERIKTDDATPDDPQKGKWGGLSENKNRKIAAVIKETDYSQEIFTINLQVISTDVSNKPLVGDVVFHIHPSFPKDVMTVTATNGVAELSLVAYGAFTVGVVCDNGATLLEMNLAEIKDAPELFKMR